MESAQAMPTDFRRLARRIYSGAAPLSVLADVGLDVAAVTVQSLTTNWGSPKRRLLESFLSRPTIVVVDEAHHIAAPGYVEILDHLRASPSLRGIIGLTACLGCFRSRRNRRLTKHSPTKIYEETLNISSRDSCSPDPSFTRLRTRFDGQVDYAA